jgi:MFS family permease
MATRQQTIDRLGGWLSLACALHCALGPALLLLAGLGAPVAKELELLEDGRVELGFAIAALLFVSLSVALRLRDPGTEGRRPMFAGFAAGLVLIFGSRVVPGPDWLEHLLLISGALILATTHRRSLRAAREALCCADPAAPAPAALLP